LTTLFLLDDAKGFTVACIWGKPADWLMDRLVDQQDLLDGTLTRDLGPPPRPWPTFSPFLLLGLSLYPLWDCDAQRSSSSYFLKPDLHSRTVSSDCSLSHGAANPLRDFTGGESEAARRADALRELQEVLKGLQAIPLADATRQ
jgi:hypothetical protein